MADETRGTKRHTVGQGGRLWAYLHDPSPLGGADGLAAQKSMVDRLASKIERRIERYIIDSGSRTTRDGRGARIQAMIEEVRSRDVEVTLIFADIANLATTADGRRRAIADLLACGITLKDGSGELHPSPRTIALARAAATRRMPDRKRRNRAQEHDLE